jgi:predicted esterase
LTSIVQVDGVPVKIENGTRENARAWFLYSEDDPADATLSQSKIKMRYKGLEELLDVIHRGLEACTGKVGVFGFSQGAVFVHLLLAHPPFFDRIKYGILASGFPAQHLCDSKASHQRMVDVPTLHLIGRKDTSVAPKHSQELVDLFKNAAVLWHDKGHIIPQQSEQCYTIISFLDLVLGLR